MTQISFQSNCTIAMDICIVREAAERVLLQEGSTPTLKELLHLCAQLSAQSLFLDQLSTCHISIPELHTHKTSHLQDAQSVEQMKTLVQGT